MDNSKPQSDTEFHSRDVRQDGGGGNGTGNATQEETQTTQTQSEEHIVVSVPQEEKFRPKNPDCESSSKDQLSTGEVHWNICN